MKIYLYDTEIDQITVGCLSVFDFEKKLKLANGEDIEVHISSADGRCDNAIAIYDMLKAYPGKVTMFVDSLAGNAASIVSMAGNEVWMNKYALLMLHKPMIMSVALDYSSGVRLDQDKVNACHQRIAQILSDRSGLDIVTTNSFLNSVTWMTADQALDLGFIDRIYDHHIETPNADLIKGYIDTAPAVYQRSISRIINTKANHPNQDIIEKTASVLDRLRNFFKRVVNKSTVTSLGTLYHPGELTFGIDVYQDEDLTILAADGTYTTDFSKLVPTGIIEVQDGKAYPGRPKFDNSYADDIEHDRTTESDFQFRIERLKNKLKKQSELLAQARLSLEESNERLRRAREL